MNFKKCHFNQRNKCNNNNKFNNNTNKLLIKANIIILNNLLIKKQAKSILSKILKEAQFFKNLQNKILKKDKVKVII